MTVWRPASRIGVKALGLHWRDGRLLASDVYDDTGAVKGVRPLGGSIELGETWDVALRREFMEELGVQVALRGEVMVMENIFMHHGVQGHEVLFVSEVVFPDGAYAGEDVLTYSEDNGEVCTARWHDPATMDVPLFPNGLAARLGV